MFDSEFVEESLEFIEESEALLLSLEGRLNHYHDTSELSLVLAPFMRCLHSLKGASSMYGLVEIVDYTHHLEQQVIKDIPQLENEHLAFYLRELDKLRKVFEIQDVKFLKDSGKVLVSIVEPEDEKIHNNKEFEENLSSEQKVEIEAKSQIAFIDDEPDLHEIFKDRCQGFNWQITSFTDPTRVDQFQNYDLFIIDYSMPEMNGIDLIKKIRLHQFNTPILLLSGFVTKELCLEAFQYEHVVVVEKSPSFELLLLNASQQIEKNQAYKLLGKSLDLIKYHFGDLHLFLKDQGMERLSDLISKDIQGLEKERKKLKI